MTATLTPTTTPPGLRRTGWMLALSPLAFVAVVGSVAVMDVGLMADLDAAALAARSGLWVAFHVLYAAAIVLGAWGLFRLDRALDGALPTLSTVAAAAAVAAVVTCGLLRVAMLGAGPGRLGDLPQFPIAETLSMLAVWCAAAATALAGAALRAGRVLRRTGTAVAVAATLYVVVDVITGGAFPPFVVSLLWLAIGVALLRRRVS